MRINQRIVSTRDQIDYLIVDICHEQKLIAVTDLKKKVPLRPFTLRLDMLAAQLGKKAWQLEESANSPLLYSTDDELIKKSSNRAKWLKKRDEAFDVISPLVLDPTKRYQYLFDDSAGLLEELIHNSAHKRKYVSQKLNRYWYFGSHKNALLPLWRECGSNQTLPVKPAIDIKGNIKLDNKSGPKTRYGNPYRGITEQDLKAIEKFAKKIPSGSKVRLTYLYEEFCREYLYPTIKPKLKNSASLTFRLPRNHLISPESFKYHLKKAVGPLVFIRKEVGEISFKKDKSGKPGLARQDLRGPTDRYEIDATMVDEYILFPYDKEQLLSCGRPTVYLIADTWSGMIVGVHASFSSPNWSGASQALFNALTDKVEFCKQYDIEITEEDWPCHHACNQLVMDRGSEYTDKNIEAILIGKIGISLAGFTPYHRGDMKGTVEQAFRIYQKTAVNFVAGQVVKTPQKEAQHASRSVAMSFDDFMKRLIKTIMYTNNNRARVNNHNFEMSRDDIGFTPRELYTYGLREMVIPPATVPVDQLRFALLPLGKATIRPQGVYFEGLFYSSNEIVRRQWLDLAKNEGRIKIEIRYDDNSTNYVWWQDETDDEILQLELTDRSEAYRNQIRANALHQIELTKHKLSHHKEKEHSEKIDLLNELKEIDKQTLAKTKHRKKSHAKTIQPGIKVRNQIVGDVEKQQRSKDITNILGDKQSQKPRNKQQNLDEPDPFESEE
mgnify:CR=1 FL=1